MLDISRDGSIQTLQMQRPPVNALNAELIQALNNALQEAMQDQAVRVVILTGSPGVFSAGLDVREMTQGPEAAAKIVKSFFVLQNTLALGDKPVIAAITGHCPAGGTVLSLLCDQRLMVEGDFRIGLNEVQVGLYPGLTIWKIFERLLGFRRAADLLSRGVMLSPSQALEVGLVDELCAPDTLRVRALERAEELLQLPPKTYLRTRALIRRELRQWYEQPEESLQELIAEGWVNEESMARLQALVR
jgi:3,2-trans-enoyl-CoA isomerase